MQILGCSSVELVSPQLSRLFRSTIISDPQDLEQISASMQLLQEAIHAQGHLSPWGCLWEKQVLQRTVWDFFRESAGHCQVLRAGRWKGLLLKKVQESDKIQHYAPPKLRGRGVACLWKHAQEKGQQENLELKYWARRDHAAITDTEHIEVRVESIDDGAVSWSEFGVQSDWDSEIDNIGGCRE